ncbi:MAG: SagB/ThcOx family dehydrogenase [Acidobacteria bacterium]|nr:SagB/ThcOx family dehydrogenase [Acidobacteriota bacterium]
MKSPAQSTETPLRQLNQPRLREIPADRIALPEPSFAGSAPIEYCLRNRRSARDFSGDPLPLAQVSQLLWAALGLTATGGLRTSPSAGSLYPVRGYLIAGNVTGLAPGVYSYDADFHALALLAKGDKRGRLAKICAGQHCVAECSAAILLTAWYKRAIAEFGDSARALTAMEAGHIGQSFCLQATALGIGAIGVSKFYPTILRMFLPVPRDEEPLYLLLAGKT